MAGMIPGVECARRRRLHQSGGPLASPSMAAHGWTRRSSFCLYTSNHETHHHTSSIISSLRRSIKSQAYQDEKLGGAAREARERLDERLRTQGRSVETKRQLIGGKESLKCVDGRSGELHTEAFGSSKNSSGSRSGSKRFSWTKLSWKTSEQEECAICLENMFNMGETLVHLPCAHRFHGRCLVPWLEANAHCPCCRMEISPPPILPSPN